MWASSNCSLVRESTADRPGGDRGLEPVRGERVGAPIDSTRGPRLSETMWPMLGGLLPTVAIASSTNSSSLSKARARLWRRSKPIVELVLRSIPELPQSEPPRWPGPDLGFLRQGHETIVQRAEDVDGALARLDRQIGPGDVADEERVAAQHRPGLVAAGGVAQQERGVLGPMAGGMDRLDRRSLAERQRPAVDERLVRVLGRRQLVDVDRRPGCPRQSPVPGDVVGVVVGLEHVLDPHPVQARQAQVGVDVPLRVDYRGDARGRIADQVGGAAEVLVDYLAEEHLSGVYRIGGRTATVPEG